VQEPGLEALWSRVSQALEKAGVEYAVVGSVASSFHGEPRMTRDVDVVARILRSNVATLAREFPEEDFYFDRDMVLESLKTRQPFNTTAEDTMVAKLRWSKLAESERQLQDAAGIVRVRGAQLDRALIDALVVRLGLEAEWARTLVLAGE
jgi:hypothetical protein